MMCSRVPYMNTRQVLLSVAVLLLMAPVVRAGDPPPRPAAAPGARPGLPNGASFGSSRTAILGNAWTSENVPIKNAQLRLRNVATGRIASTTVANQAGQFTFANI